jgi:hypothetical protein
MIYPPFPERRFPVEAILERCCGINDHKKTIITCLMVGKPDEKLKKIIKTFTTMTRDLLVCKDWLESEQCTHVALESTGVYWEAYLRRNGSTVGLRPGNQIASTRLDLNNKPIKGSCH